MKKTYIAPDIQVIELLDDPSILCVSAPGVRGALPDEEDWS